MLKNIFFLFLSVALYAQPNTSEKQQLKTFFDTSLLDGHAYEWLDYLTNRIGSRLSGSLGAERAVAWTKAELEAMGLDRVYLQAVKVPKWVRGAKEFALIETSPGVTFNVPITALGGSVATPSVGLKAFVVEVQGIEELKALGRAQIE